MSVLTLRGHKVFVGIVVVTVVMTGSEGRGVTGVGQLEKEGRL